MDLQGKTQHHRAKVNTGGELKASRLETDETEVFLTTGAVADVFAKNTLQVFSMNPFSFIGKTRLGIHHFV